MSDTSARTVWGVYGDSARGSSHLRNGLPNQDSIEKWAGPGGSPAILAVSDGHGSASHFRSDAGSRMGVEAAVHALRETPVPLPDGYSRVLAHSIVQTWREAVLTHLAANPFTDHEWAKLPAKDVAQAQSAILANPPIAYGATLLAVWAAESEILYLQLGDGDILCVDQNGGATRPVPQDSRLIANQTTSLCQVTAGEDFRAAHFRTADGPPPALILVSSDGYSNSFQSDEDFLRVGPDYLDLLRQFGPEKVEAQLQKILPEASRKGSGDDITLGFLQRMDTAATPAPGPLSEPLAADPETAPQSPPPPAIQAAAEPTPPPLEAVPAATAACAQPVPESATTALHAPSAGAQPVPESATTALHAPSAGAQPVPESAPAALVSPSGATAATPGRQPDPPPAAGTGARPATPEPARDTPDRGRDPGGSTAVSWRTQPEEETHRLRRKLFWLKMALAAVCLLALAGAGLAWRRPLWVSGLIERIRPKPQHPPRRDPEQHPNQEAPRTRERSELRFRVRSCGTAGGLATGWPRAIGAPRERRDSSICGLCKSGVS